MGFFPRAHSDTMTIDATSANTDENNVISDAYKSKMIDEMIKPSPDMMPKTSSYLDFVKPSSRQENFSGASE